MNVSRIKYANMYGPTVGDKVRLGDTELFIEIEQSMRPVFDQLGIAIARAPFGWTKTLEFKVKGHPMAENSKLFQ